MKNDLFIANLAAYTAPQIVEIKNKDWVYYGEDNMYFNHLIELYMNSTTNHSIINGVSNQVYGRGIAALNADMRPDQYAQMMQIFRKTDLRKFIKDFKLLGMAAFQISYKNGKVAAATHFPMETLRAEKCNDEGEITGWYYSNDWLKVGPRSQPERITAFGHGNKKENEMFVLRPYVTGHYYYSPCDYTGALPYAKLENEIGDYLINDCINNFSGTKVVNFNNGVPDPEKMQQVKTDILGKLTGSRGEKVIVAFNNNQESKTTVDDIPLNDAPAHYQYLADECFKKLIVGHRVTSPMLLGIRDGNTGLGNNAEEIETATLLMDNIVIKCYQDNIIDAMDDILAVNDIALDLYFKTLKPLAFNDIDQLEGVDDDTKEEETGVEMEMSQDITPELQEFIDAGEDIDEQTWEVVMDENVNYEAEEELDKIIAKLEESQHEKLSTFNKIWNFVSTGKAIPNAKSAQDKKIGEYYFKTRYYYYPKKYNGGKTDSPRAFCVAMVNANKLYRKEDIIRMKNSAVNPGWGPRGAATYSIWKYKGGGNCHHSWRRVVYKSKEAKIDVKTSKQIIGTGAARIDGYKITNDWQVSVQPRNLPNKGFLPGNPQGK